MVKTTQVETEERELLDSYERGEWRSDHISPAQRDRYRSYALAALEAEGLISIILPTEDLKAVRRKAAEAGIPYQTLIANIVHEFLTGRLVATPNA